MQRTAVWVFGIIRMTMRIGTMPNQGDIVLIPIPFTDLSSSKRRPVIVVSNNAYHTTNTDIVVVAMTSNPGLVSYSLIITSTDLLRGDNQTIGYKSRVRS